MNSAGETTQVKNVLRKLLEIYHLHYFPSDLQYTLEKFTFPELLQDCENAITKAIQNNRVFQLANCYLQLQRLMHIRDGYYREILFL